MIHVPIKVILRELIPPILWRGLSRLGNKNIILKGPYVSWQEARQHSTGYDQDLILHKVRDALLLVREGKAAGERDSVLFDKIQYSFPVLAGLLKVALANQGNLSVLDFGGSLGSSYYQFRKFLSEVKNLRWIIVEQEKFVACGQEIFQNEELRFYATLAECWQRENPAVVLLSNVIQYLEDPYGLIESILAHDFPCLIIDSTPFHHKADDLILVQHIPKEIYLASYPMHIFSFEKFISHLTGKYKIIADFNALTFPALEKFQAKSQGFILTRR